MASDEALRATCGPLILHTWQRVHVRQFSPGADATCHLPEFRRDATSQISIGYRAAKTGSWLKAISEFIQTRWWLALRFGIAFVKFF